MSKLDDIKLSHVAATLGIAALALVGCGNTQLNEEPQNAEEAQQQYADELEEQGDMQEPVLQTAGHGTYKVHAISGAELEFDLPTAPDHELLAELESFREDLGQVPVSYIVTDIDNRLVTETLNRGAPLWSLSRPYPSCRL